jgi:pimeloyl-ACP methyl ester carboxylesterase
MKFGTIFDVPVLGIQASAPGIDDRTAAMRTLFPRLRVEKWDGAGHFLMLEDAARFNQTLEGFLATIGKEPRP